MAATARRSAHPFAPTMSAACCAPKSCARPSASTAPSGAADPAFVEIQERAIRDVVELQEDAGLQVVTDGEFRRSSYWGRFVERCQGFIIKPAVFKFRDDHGHEVDFTATYANARLERTQPLATDEFEFLRKVTKVTRQDHHAGALDHALLPLHRFCRRVRLCRCARPSSPTSPASTARRSPISPRPAAATCSSTRWPSPCCAIRPSATRSRRRARTRTGWSISTSRPSTTAVAGAPADMLIGIHMCRGNFRGRYLSEGGYESVAERFFKNTNVTHFLLEYDTARAGDFKPLRFVPKSKGVVLGLVSTKTPVLENDRRSEAPHRGGREVHRPRSARHRAAMRVCLHRSRQSADRGRRARQARPGGGGGAGDLGLSCVDGTGDAEERPAIGRLVLSAVDGATTPSG